MNAEPLPSALGLARIAMRRRRAAGLGRALRCGALALPATLIRILFWPRDPGITGLSDSQLADIGLTRADVEGAGRDPASRARAEMLRHHGRWRV
jgi:hypothetical protein